MGTYDTRGGSPISPGEPDYSPTQLEDDVLGVLEALDIARSNAREVLSVVFKRIVVKRYPIGAKVDLSRVTLTTGYSRFSTHAQVLGHMDPEINVARPEVSKIGVQCVTLQQDGSQSNNVVRFDERVLGHHYDINWARHPMKDRDVLIQLVHDLDVNEAESN